MNDAEYAELWWFQNFYYLKCVGDKPRVGSPLTGRQFQITERKFDDSSD